MRDYLGIAETDSSAHGDVTTEYTTLIEIGDAADGRNTKYEMSPGDTFLGDIDSFGDRDWVAVELTAGQTYEIDLIGVTLVDPYLRLYNSSGKLVAQNDDGGDLFLSSEITYTASYTGTYYISAAAWEDFWVGSYVLGIEADYSTTVVSDEVIAEQLTDGYWNAFGGSRRSFDVEPGGTLTADISGLTTEGQYLAEQALLAWTYVTGIEFVFVTGGADITFDDEDPGAYSSTTVSGDTIISSQVNISTDWLDAYGTDIDSYSFQTYVHEIGHALGLGHAGNYNGTATYGVDNEFANDSWQASVMSYFAQDENPYIDADFAFIVTPMQADILAMQDLYGTSGDIRTGDTTYGFNSTAGGYYDEIVFMDQPVAFTILDDGGFDTLDLSGTSEDQYIDLRVGATSDVLGLTGNMSIANGTRIELVIGGAGADEVYGSKARNKVEAGAGNDTLWGNDGGDNLKGGAGGDFIDGGGAADRLYGGNANDELHGGNGKDRLWGNAGRDVLHGGDMSDILIGGNGADTLYGERGSDTLKGGRGDGDVLYGGAGEDQFVFRKSYGDDTIADFTDGKDTIVIETGANEFSDLSITDGADGAVVAFTGVTITLTGVVASDLDNADFLFT